MLLSEMVWGKDYNAAQPRDDAGRWASGTLLSRSPGSSKTGVDASTTNELRDYARSITSIVTSGAGKPPTEDQVEQVAHLLSQHDPKVVRRLRRVALYESNKVFDKEYGNVVGKHGGRVVAFWKDIYDSINLRPGFEDSTFHHEVGHQAWKASSPESKQRWISAYRNPNFDRSTTYSRVSHREGFSEAYSAFIHSGGRAISPKIQDTFKGVSDVISSIL